MRSLVARCSRDAVRNNRVGGRYGSHQGRVPAEINGGQEGASGHLSSIENETTTLINFVNL